MQKLLIFGLNQQNPESIARTCYIDNIVYQYEDMIGKVDAILLARDDSNHYKIAKPFLMLDCQYILINR